MTEATITIEDYQVPNTENIIKIANVSGQLDESNVDEKIKEIYKVLEQIPTGLKLILNLENLNYMNSKSIGYVTDLYGKITKGSGLVVIASAKANIIDVLQVVGLTQLLKTFDSLDDAKKYLSETSAGEALAEPQATPPATPAAPPATPAAPPAAPAAPPAEETPQAPTAESVAPSEKPETEGDTNPPTTQ